MTEIQDIFREGSKEYAMKHKLPFHIHKTIGDISSCRTAELGGHIDECDDCGHTRISYNSCRNRHCPKCQTVAKEKWLYKRQQDLLPIGYFHVVFTIPQELNYLTLTNQKEMYSLLFKATSETLVELSKDRKYLGAEIGFTSILHTWGQNLINHPHIHCVVPSGGLSVDGQRWISSKKKFFIPVKVLSRKFRGKYLFYLKKLLDENKLKFLGENDHLAQQDILKLYIDKLYSKEWVVYCKPPFGSAEAVLQYLGRYTHRVAISNNRIVQAENGFVVFKWRDYADNNQQKFMTVTTEEFIRRFIMHILPTKFVKIRHYGILSNRSRVTKLKRCKSILGVKKSSESLKNLSNLSVVELFLKITGIDILKCPCCTKGKMERKRKVNPSICSPPKL
ncbi:MAG: IS91 family transposase [Clostridiaceae bacterium]|nr:IS91 family transposase [Clostridiaceae bacterium]